MADECDRAGAFRRGVPAGEPRAVRAPQPGPPEAGAPVHGRDGHAAARRAGRRHPPPAHRHAAATRSVHTLIATPAVPVAKSSVSCGKRPKYSTSSKILLICYSNYYQ